VLEPLTAHDIGQAAHKKDRRQDEEKQVEHIPPFSTNGVLDRALWVDRYSAIKVKTLSKDFLATSRWRKSPSAAFLSS